MKHLLFYWKNRNVYLMKLVSKALFKYACKAPFETQDNFSQFHYNSPNSFSDSQR